MNELLWQTILLLVGAFFLGAVLACGLKRRFYYGPAVRKAPADLAPELLPATAPTPDAAQPKVEVAARPAAEGVRFERALSGKATAPAAPALPLAAPQPAAPVAAPATSAPAPAAPAASQPMPRVSVATGSGAPTKLEEGGAAPSEDLTRIRGIDGGLQKQLNELGIRHFEELATLNADRHQGPERRAARRRRGASNRRTGSARRRSWRSGGETYYSRRLDRGTPVPAAAEPPSRERLLQLLPPHRPRRFNPLRAADDSVHCARCAPKRCSVRRRRVCRAPSDRGRRPQTHPRHRRTDRKEA